MWRNGVSVTDHGVTANFIDVTIDDGRKWRCTGFYGEPARENKHKSWEYLRGLHQMRDEPWIAFGDFNEILFMHEKEGGAAREQRSMQAFRAALSECELEEMGLTGGRLYMEQRTDQGKA